MTPAERFLAKVRPADERGCWLWNAYANVDGYGRIRVNRRLLLAHRVSYELFVGPIPAGAVIRHRCDVKGCVNPAHLESGTPLDNARDMVERGRQARGETNANTKLTAAQVMAARRRVANGETHRRVAADYGVAKATISHAVTGRTWRHLGAA
jgi:hypothetical protein